MDRSPEQLPQRTQRTARYQSASISRISSGARGTPLSRWISHALVIICLIGAKNRPLAAEEVTVETTSGVVFSGDRKKAGKLTMINDGTTEVLLTDQVIRTLKPLKNAAESFHFTINQDKLNAQPQGKIPLVVQKTHWLSAPDDHGRLQADITLPDGKVVRNTYWITDVSDKTYTLTAVEYEHQLSFPLNVSYARTCLSVLINEISVDDLAQQRQLMAWSGRVGTEGFLFSIYQKFPHLVEDNQAQEAFRTAQQPKPAVLLKQLAVALALDQPELAGDAPEQLEKIGHTSALRATWDAQYATVTSARQLLTEQHISLEHLTFSEAQRLLQHAHLMTPENAIWLMQAWSGGLKADDDLAACLNLAEQIAHYFQQQDPQKAETAALIRRIETSTIRKDLIVAMMSWARNYPVPDETSFSVQEITWQHPQEQQKFTYAVRLPEDYKPYRPHPVLITLHGQNGVPAHMLKRMAPFASQLGAIIISPKYIYGRKWGYKATEEEHRAIADVLWDASKRWNIDSDRVWLYGHSQGGHSTFAVGATQSEHFAGIVPMIGTSLFPATRQGLRNIALYTVGGSEDAGAPALTRETFQELAKWNSQSIYVEYLGRGHEAFTEEWPNLVHWLSQQKRNPYPESIHFTPLNKADDGLHWLRVQRWGSSRDARRLLENPNLVTAQWKGKRISIDSKGPKSLYLDIPPQYAGDSLSVQINRRSKKLSSLRNIRINWRDMIQGIQESGDRQRLMIARIPLRVR